MSPNARPPNEGPTSTSERGQQVRATLRQAAAELIPELGWHAVSTRLVADRAGLTPGLIHYHFQSLPTLLREAALEVMREVIAQLQPMLAAADSRDSGLALMLSSLDEYDGTDPTSRLLTEAYLASDRDPELHAGVRAVVDEFRTSIADWLRAYGEPRPAATAAVFAALIDGVMLHRSLDPDITAATVTPSLRRLLTPLPEETPEEEAR